MTRVALMTSDGQRHRWVAARVAAQLNVVLIVAEQKAPAVAAPADVPELSPDDAATIRQHFAARDVAERALLGDRSEWPPSTNVLPVPHGESNSDAVRHRLVAAAPDAVLLFGTSIIRRPLLEAFSGRVINLHLGLSPWYRGSATNFWPLVNRQPELVGATIHVAEPKVDAGPILGQVRPAVEPADGSHEIGTRALIAAVDAWPRLITEYLAGSRPGHPQDLSSGTVYRLRNFNADAVRTMWQHFQTGMVADYLADRAARCAAYPIVE